MIKNIKKIIVAERSLCDRNNYNQGTDFDGMSSFFPCEIDDIIGYGAQAPKIVIL